MIVIVVVILAIGGYWYVRRRDEKEELPELRPLTPLRLDFYQADVYSRC